MSGDEYFGTLIKRNRDKERVRDTLRTKANYIVSDMIAINRGVNNSGFTDEQLAEAITDSLSTANLGLSKLIVDDVDKKEILRDAVTEKITDFAYRLVRHGQADFYTEYGSFARTCGKTPKAALMLEALSHMKTALQEAGMKPRRILCSEHGRSGM